MSKEIKTLVMTRKKGERIEFKIDDQILFDILVVDVSNKTVTFSFRVSDKVKISHIKSLLLEKPKVQ